MNVSAWSIKNPIPAIMLFVLLTLAGILTYRASVVQDFPDIELPIVTVQLKVPAGTQAGQKLRLSGRGLPKPHEGAGDLFAIVQIAVPNKLTTEQREKLTEFGKALGENNSPLHESFFAKAKKFFG